MLLGVLHRIYTTVADKVSQVRVPKNRENEISCQWKYHAFYIGYLPLFSMTIKHIFRNINATLSKINSLLCLLNFTRWLSLWSCVLAYSNIFINSIIHTVALSMTLERSITLFLRTNWLHYVVQKSLASSQFMLAERKCTMLINSDLILTVLLLNLNECISNPYNF